MENQAPLLTAELLREESANNPQIDVEAKRKYKEFADRFNYSKLENLSDEELLPYVFRGLNKSNLCDTLEFGKLCEDFGNIYLQGGVKAYGLYNKDGKWCA
ncbi:MAG: hypothetical protein LUD29_00295, partial [Clostridia bacterium]|nr:hypothetical protein [Clostridia bacterium]